MQRMVNANFDNLTKFSGVANYPLRRPPLRDGVRLDNMAYWAR